MLSGTVEFDVGGAVDFELAKFMQGNSLRKKAVVSCVGIELNGYGHGFYGVDGWCETASQKPVDRSGTFLAETIPVISKCRGISWVMPLVLGACWFGSAGLLSAQIVNTGDPNDLAIDGPGWFVLRDPPTSRCYVTRLGQFQVDDNGYIISSQGYRLQGYCTPDLTVQGDLRITTLYPPDSAWIAAWYYDSDGQILLIFDDGTEVVGGQVLLQNFSAPGKLLRVRLGLDAITAEAGPLAQLVIPGTAGLGTIVDQSLDETPEPVCLTLLPSAAQTGALTQGAITPTEIETDLAIRGDGFFLVRDTNSSELFATRAGTFLRDAGGYLVTYNGDRLQGYSDPGLSIPGDVTIDAGDSAALGIPQGYCFNADGSIDVWLADGTAFVSSQVCVFTFTRPELLIATNYGRYSGVVQAEPQFSQNFWVFENSLELVNVSADLLALRQARSFFPQWPICNDDYSDHLAISGQGFFLLRDPVSGVRCVTRLGAFYCDNDGYVVSSNGFRLQGYSDSGLSILGDLRIDATGSTEPQAQVADHCFATDGTIEVVLQGGTDFVRGQVLLQAFHDPSVLLPAGGYCYTNLDAAGPFPTLWPPGCYGVGYLIGDALEQVSTPSTLVLPSRNGMRVFITGEPGYQWTIQASTDLTTWTSLEESAESPDEMDFTDIASSSYASRFYRVLVGPPSF